LGRKTQIVLKKFKKT